MNILTSAVLIWVVLVAPAHAQQIIQVDFTAGQLLHFYGEGQYDIYPVVLPRLEVQRSLNLVRPVLGQLISTDYKPTWWPTVNMGRKYPSLPRSVSYGYPGHPIGIYRLRIDWENPTNPSFWQPVRIHGGAKTIDLYQAKSAGCVRMLDEDIVRLVKKINHLRQTDEAAVQISFGFFH